MTGYIAAPQTKEDKTLHTPHPTSPWKLLCLVVCLLLLPYTTAHAEEKKEVETSAMGASLLQPGEVAMTFGVGFPDAFFRFDFANSESINLAAQIKFNYNLSIPFFGANVFATMPTRFGIVQNSELNFALLAEPGIYLGGGHFDGFYIGIPLNLGALFSLHLVPKLSINFGIEFPMLLAFDVTNGTRTINGFGDKINPIGFNLPIEFVVGAEYRINKQLALFARLSGGPSLFVGTLAELESAATPGNSGRPVDSVIATGVLRFAIGLVYRRNP